MRFHMEVQRFVSYPYAYAAYAPAPAGAEAGVGRPARTLPGVDDRHASSHAICRLRQSAAGVYLLRGGICFHLCPPGGAAVYPRLGAESGQCARAPVETIAEDLRLSPAHAGACLHSRGG